MSGVFAVTKLVYSSSSTSAPVLQAFAFVPVVTVYMCGWCTGVTKRKEEKKRRGNYRL